MEANKLNKTVIQEGETETSAAVFQVERLYISEQSFKVLQKDWQVLSKEWRPEISTELRIQAALLKKEQHEVTVHLHNTVKLNNQTVFVMDVHQVGIFKLSSLSQEELQGALNITCPTILYPYACKVAAGLSVDGGFPALVLLPVNFQLMYEQGKEQVVKSESEETASIN